MQIVALTIHRKVKYLKCNKNQITWVFYPPVHVSSFQIIKKNIIITQKIDMYSTNINLHKDQFTLFIFIYIYTSVWRWSEWKVQPLENKDRKRQNF